MSTVTESQFLSSSAFFDALPPSSAESQAVGGTSPSSNADPDFVDQQSPARTPLHDQDEHALDDLHLRSPPSSGEADLPSMSNQQTPSPLFDDAPLVGHSEVDCAYCHKPYRKPRVLHCLHAMCEDCIIAQLEGHRFEEPKPSNLDCELEPSSSPVVRPPPGVIRCPVCQQDSNVGNDMRFVNQLLLDYVRINELEAKAIDKQQRPCEACKSDEAAVALCQDCSSNLCSNCVQAHHFMRCFENHKVVSFSEIKRATESGEAMYIHRPVVCSLHNEQYRSMCVTCESLVCAQCELTDHKVPDHHTMGVTPELDSAVRYELTTLCRQAEDKAKVSETAHMLAEERVAELGVKLDKAKDDVERTFAEYEELLAKRKESILEGLEKARDQQDNQLCTTFQRIENSVQKIVDAVEFTKRLTAHANTMELMDSRKTVMQQLTQLVHSIPNPNVCVDLGYLADVDRFKQALYTCCGEIRKGIHAAPAQIVNAKELKPEPVVAPTQFRPTTLGPISVAGVEPLAGAYSNAPPEVTNNSWAQPVRTAMPAVIPPIATQHTIQQQQTSPLYGGPGTIGMERGSRQQLSTAPPMRQAQMGWTNEDQLTLLARQMVFHNVGPVPSPVVPLPQQQQQLQASNWGHGFATSGAAAAAAHNNAYAQGRFGNSRGTTPPNGWTQQQQQAPDMSALNSRASAVPMAPTAQYADYMFGYGSQNVAAPPGAVSMGQMAPGQVRQLSLRRTPVEDAQSDHDRTSSNTPSDSGNASIGAMGSGKSSLRSPKPMNSLHMFGSLGPAPGQFNSPHGFCLGFDDEIVVADTNNHRIQVMSKAGVAIHHFGKPGKGDGELFYPRKVALIRGRDPRFVVCDRGNERSRMQVFNRRGEFVKKIVIRYVDIVAGLSVDGEGKIIVVDSVSPTVFRINSDTGELEKWFDCSEYMKEPSDIAVFGHEYFICDFKGNCVCVFADDGRFMRKIGSEDLTPFPNGIDVSNAGDVLIGDSHGNRFHVSVFKKAGDFVQDFECATVKVSRCCGLRITAEGYVVTLAKNNHHLLVLDTLYVH